MSLPLLIPGSPSTGAEFIACETGAAEDDIRGPSPLTTVEILSRHHNAIEVRTPEEAAQIADCCYFGTFSSYCPTAAPRIREKCVKVEGAAAMLREWGDQEWKSLWDLLTEVGAKK